MDNNADSEGLFIFLWQIYTPSTIMKEKSFVWDLLVVDNNKMNAFFSI